VQTLLRESPLKIRQIAATTPTPFLHHTLGRAINYLSGTIQPQPDF
jgi:hypothetical protein